MGRITHPQLTRAIKEHWPSICNIVQIPIDTTASGQQAPAVGVDPQIVPGLANIRCSLALFRYPAQYDEKRNSGVVASFADRTLKLDGYFPQIVARFMKAQVDGILFEIRGVESDSLHTCTRLRVEKVVL